MYLNSLYFFLSLSLAPSCVCVLFFTLIVDNTMGFYIWYFVFRDLTLVVLHI